MAGLEPATFSFVVRRSKFQLSYTEGIHRNQKANIKRVALNFLSKAFFRIPLLPFALCLLIFKHLVWMAGIEPA